METEREKASASSRSTNGPLVRAQRDTSWSRASVIVSTCAGVPGGTGMPRPSRSNAASWAWAKCMRPPMRTSMMRWLSCWCRVLSGTSVCSPKLSTGIGPITRNISATCSLVCARRVASVRCSWAWTSAIISGSRSSRNSTVPNNLANNAGSRARAAARFSASGLSPSYINAPV